MLRSPLTPILLTVFVDVLGLTIVLPLLTPYAERFGASPSVVGLLGATYPACQLISGPLLGRISDRAGRKPTLIASQMGTFVGFLTLASASSLWMLFLGRTIDGFTAGNLSIAQAYISDVTKPEERTKAFALIGVAFGGGFLLGPAISGALAHRFGFGAPMYGAAFLSLTSIALSWRLLPRVDPTRDPAAPPVARRTLRLTEYWRRPLPRRRLLEFFAFTLSFATLVGGLVLFLERRFGFNVEQVGYTYAFSGLVGGIIQGRIIGGLVKRYGEGKLALVGFVAMAIGYSSLGAIGSVPMLFVLVAISSFGVAVVRPCLTTLLTKSVGRDEQGAALGASQSVASLSQISGWLLATNLIEHQRLGAYGLAAGAFAFVGAVLRLQRDPT
jgi:predicted MFS family arabinose efflux permease